jgi:hypothetical protein
VNDQKMGTHYVREACQTFREIAAQSKFPVIKEKLTDLADRFEPMAGKLYFKTQRGTEDMREMAKEIEDFKGKMLACSQIEEAQSMCLPFFAKLNKALEMVETLKVRIT